MRLCTAVLLAVAFGAELAAFASAGVGVGWTTGGPPGVVAGIAATALLVAVWARWCAPRAPARLSDPGLLATQLAVFACVALALVAAGHPLAGLAVGCSALHLPLLRVVGAAHPAELPGG